MEKETETVFPKGEKQQYQKCSVVDALKAVSAALQSELERVSRWKSSVASKQTTEQHDLKCLITKKFEQISKKQFFVRFFFANFHNVEILHSSSVMIPTLSSPPQGLTSIAGQWTLIYH